MNKIKEGKVLDAFTAWLDDNPDNLEVIQEEPIKKIFDTYFRPWADENKVKVSYPSFINIVKKYLHDNELFNPYSKNSLVRKGQSVVLTSDGSKEEKKFNAMKSIEADEKFKMIETYTEMMKNAYINSLIIYGTPGIGKDHTVETVLGKDARYFKGGLKGSFDLIKLLYTYRDNEILVFSDFDSVFKTPEMKNILKTALEDKKERVLTWVDSSKRPKRDAIPSQFTFTSGIIFISNLKRFDPAIKSRSISVEIILTKEEILKRIESVLETFLPNFPMKDKKEVFSFLVDNSKSYQKIDFRQFKFCLVNYYGKPDSWKQWSLVQLNS